MNQKFVLSFCPEYTKQSALYLGMHNCDIAANQEHYTLTRFLFIDTCTYSIALISTTIINSQSHHYECKSYPFNLLVMYESQFRVLK